MPFFRQFQHLLPQARAWRLTIDKTLRRFFEGLAGGAPVDARAYIDDVFDDVFPPTTRELEQWEEQFGMFLQGTEPQRRLALAAEWAATGGQSPSYIQGIIQAAGFTDVFIYDWWSSGPPYVAIDPRLHTNKPLIGTEQSSAFPDQPQCQAATDAFGNPIPGQPQCNRFLANEVGYIVNNTLTPVAPPEVPDDPAFWPYFIYFAGPVFPTPAVVPNSRRFEFERLLLKLNPMQNWIVTIVDYQTVGLFGPSFDSTFE